MSKRNDQVKALSSEVRMEILRLLNQPKKHFAHQESADPEHFGVCMQLIAEKLKVSQPTISRHLELLKRAEFISVRRFQKWSYCTRNETALAEYLEWLRTDLAISGAVR
ncbi:MAG: winged helix-turn-helix transcriptional regulator [Rhodobacteraceae bacterium]|nr:winged helix-turn-helix transcriptional regulator [Paracoccaceae bacterium]